jgi:hypothetical protein
MDTARHANAAQVRYNPGPTDTVMPIGTMAPSWDTVMELTASVFFIITVHRAAPTKSRKLPRTESVDEIRNATVCFRTPLSKDFRSAAEYMQTGSIKTDLNNVNAVQMEPSSIK